MVHEIEDFYGVYLLYCLNPKFKGRTYIGYTVDPNRRIKQHNTGKHAGGAYRTSGKGPWEMALIIHGFPNEISGLRFEWAWQNPQKSRRLKDIVSAKTRKETAFQFRWRVACTMLRTAPWNSLSLTVRWLKQDFALEFPPGLESPLHMPIKYGPVVSKKVTTSKGKRAKEWTQVDQPANMSAFFGTDFRECVVCDFPVQKGERRLCCLHPSCDMLSHLTCLARHFLKDTPNRLLPVEGSCPNCGLNLLWGELIRQMKGCHNSLSETVLKDVTVTQSNNRPAALTELD